MDKPMTREEMAQWLRMRGVRTERELENWLAEYAGRTEAEMDQLYDDMHGDSV